MKAIRRFTVRTVLPAPLSGLEELAANLRWSWHQPTLDLFRGKAVTIPPMDGALKPNTALDDAEVVRHARDLYALVHDHLGHDRVVLVGGDLGGPVVQDLALRHREWVDRMVLFNSPLPYLKDRMADIVGTRPAREASDYFLRQGLDPDGLAAELATPEQRRRYIATFYTSRFWAHPGAFALPDEVDFHTEPFADAAKLRASFGGYESSFSEAACSEPARTSSRVSGPPTAPPGSAALSGGPAGPARRTLGPASR